MKRAVNTSVQTLLTILALGIFVPTMLAQKTAPPAAVEANTLTAHGRSVYGGTSTILIGSAEKMPADQYGFRPVNTVRTFGEIVAHIAQSQYVFCAVVRGQKNVAPVIDAAKASKADLVAALTEAFRYCDKTYEAMNDVSAVETVKFMGGDRPKLGVLNINNIHSIEHYGNLVTYMRMNGIVPPTSDPALMQQLQRKK